MATFFCEVLSVYSRAAEENEYDDMTNGNEEDEQIRRDQVSVHVHWLSQTDGGPVLCSDLIIAVGPNAAGFVLAYALGSDGWTAVGWVSLWNERSHGSGDPAELSCVLYQQKVTQSIEMASVDPAELSCVLYQQKSFAVVRVASEQRKFTSGLLRLQSRPSGSQEDWFLTPPSAQH
ncbi:proteasome assembly chaperone 1-like [Sinocyclocheilus anshuiensis]|uniref:proteasome assembly chaperone 1-like n=1 Tax=Sinocyclocheilus anshuiensis TaxID=1608454 RepID=UPI0007B82598|nr:PREDICTED: proteasome assembly chaperone 1-like [Sinocyclocheilus anshuiensis]